MKAAFVLFLVFCSATPMLNFIPPVRFFIDGISRPPVVSWVRLCYNASCLDQSFSLGALPNIVVMTGNITAGWTSAQVNITTRVLTYQQINL